MFMIDKEKTTPTKYGLNREEETKKKSNSLADIPVIEGSTDKMIWSRDQLKTLIEGPLLQACEELYDKNIRTISSSANRTDIKTGHVYIIIDFDSLSEENKKIALHFDSPFEYGGSQAVKIIIPVSDKTTVDEISQEAIRISGAFQKQSASWIPKYTLEDLKMIAGISADDKTYDEPSAWKDFYYDPKEQLFYDNEEHFIKAQEGKET
jgi:hypothetical protein